MTEDRQAIELLAAVARGVLELTSINRSAALRLPYPSGVQLVLDQMVLSGMTHGHPIPAGVPELMRWCRERAPEEWVRGLPDGFLTVDTRLIHPVGGEPTRTCAELASLGPYGVPEREAETLLAELATACGTAERFAACRDFLISRPVVLRPDPMELMQPAVAQIWSLVKGLYGPVPDRFPDGGLVHCCGDCGLLAKCATTGRPWCEGGCSSGDRELETSQEPQSALALPFALRLFLALPGRTEQAVRSRLTDQVQLLPMGFGVYRTTSPDGALRVFQVYDREQPGPAALRAAEIAALLGGPLDVVVPDGMAARPGYRQHFDLALPAGAQVRFVSASDFTAPGPSRRSRGNHA
ncbi:pPIWI_RE_Y domain-containing protein [Streptomyces lasiicapitis]|uniref:pPIWI_RE_Y domain-containing protein n=1 Tax=Streptomyces lasiicapitis TaxID=1923961 RepID=UPI0036D08F68